MSGAPRGEGEEVIRRAIGSGIPWHDPMSCQGAGCTDDHDEKAAHEALDSLITERDRAVEELAKRPKVYFPVTEVPDILAERDRAVKELKAAKVNEHVAPDREDVMPGEVAALHTQMPYPPQGAAENRGHPAYRQRHDAKCYFCALLDALAEAEARADRAVERAEALAASSPSNMSPGWVERWAYEEVIAQRDRAVKENEELRAWAKDIQAKGTDLHSWLCDIAEAVSGTRLRTLADLAPDVRRAVKERDGYKAVLDWIVGLDVEALGDGVYDEWAEAAAWDEVLKLARAALSGEHRAVKERDDDRTP